MNPLRIAIDRLDLAFDGLDTATAEAVQHQLPAAIQRALARRLARSGPGLQALSVTGADLGTLDLPPRADAHRAADAIAARLADWLHATTASSEP